MAAAEGQAAPQRQRRRGKGPSTEDVCSEGEGREGWSKSRVGLQTWGSGGKKIQKYSVNTYWKPLRDYERGGDVEKRRGKEE